MRKFIHTGLLNIQKRFALSLFILSLLFSVHLKSQFTPGNLVVLQIGNGATTLTNTGNPLIFNEYSTSGSLTFSVAIPSTGTNAMVLRGNATSEGYISRSADGNNIVFGAYLQSLPNTSVLNTSASSAINRGVGLIGGSGSFSIGASNTSFFTAGDVRGGAATDATNLWASGSNQGTNYFGTASTATLVQGTKTNLRAINIFNNQLYISSQVASGTPTDIGVYAIGSGTPNTSGQTVSTVINCGTGAQPGQFFFNQAGTICYVADARNTSSGGVQKWVYSSSTWSLAYTLPTGTAAIGAFGVVADFSGSNPIVYATTTESTANRLIAIQDVGASSTATTLASASTSNTIFRGLAFSPSTSTCVPASIATTTNNAPVCSDQNLVFNVTTAGTAPITYTWAGQGVFSSTSVPNPTVTNASTGAYIISVSNACGTASAAINVTINPTPTIQVNAPTICAGGIVTITATGANTYTWNNNTNAASFTANPVSTTAYTVNGTSADGCAASQVTTAITVVSSPSISVNSATICSGASVALNASGASTYTWNTNQNSSSIIVSPTVTTTYSVAGNASGCPAAVGAGATVVVNALPSPSINLTQQTFCISQKSITLSGSPTGGAFSGQFVNGSVFSPTTTGSYSITYSYTNASGCSKAVSATFTVSGCVSVNTINSNINTLSVYPNPAGNFLYVQLLQATPSSLTIYDFSYRKVLEYKTESLTTKIDISSLSPGVYFIQEGNNNQVRVKFIKE